ncbi:protein kintoun [Puntigrus tetrazona]|uniref:protein kintoun n=1 Tax=Puntigrus tetrazona TaxID=1606681 RepID=UPI001C8948ED|nr:protein kintoun [Puntigrus tetrazona]
MVTEAALPTKLQSLSFREKEIQYNNSQETECVHRKLVKFSRLFTMDFGNKLEELNLTRDEMSRLGEALKDEKFRELLRDYVAEISNPENRRKYEEEISQLEEQRGVSARFLHPEPHHVLKTRDARGKLFINICSDPLIEKPLSEAARGPRGTPGHRWRVPFSLTPARQDRDAAGNSCVTHDVIFHPDALCLAGNSRRFTKLLHSTAIGGIEDSFQVKLDKQNIKQLKMKYKGVPQAALIRRPIPGHQQNAREDLLSFPYPDQSHTEPEPDSNHTHTKQDVRSSSHQPPVPEYSVKYRSVVDLQDYRCSRDSGPGARPTQIIITVELPLLGSAGDAELSVKQRRLVLEAQNPPYKLDLKLSYPVDEDKGHAKFNKTKKQLTITLPVRPATRVESQQIRSDDMSSNDEEDEDEADQNPKQEVPEPKPDCSTLTHSAGLQPSASEPQITGLTAEPDQICFEETNVNQLVNHASNTFCSEFEITVNGGDEVSSAPETENIEESEPNTAREALLPQQPLMTPMNQQEDQCSSQDAEEPKTRRSSEDHENKAVRLQEEADRLTLREIESDSRDVFICSHKNLSTLCFQNSLWSELD